MDLLKTLLHLRSTHKKNFGTHEIDTRKILLNLISGNLEITIKEIKSIKTEINDFKKSIEFTENVLEEKSSKVPGES